MYVYTDTTKDVDASKSFFLPGVYITQPIDDTALYACAWQLRLYACIPYGGDCNHTCVLNNYNYGGECNHTYVVCSYRD